MTEDNETAAFFALVVGERFKQRRAKGQPEGVAATLAAFDAWEFIEGLADDPDLPPDYNAVDQLVTWLHLEEGVEA
jgi:hypothetical protein